MHIFLLAALLAKAATTKKAAGSSASLLFIVLIVVAVYFLVLRPRSRKNRRQQQSRTNLEVGDEVISAGGILGRVTNIVDDEIEVEVSPGTTLTFWRRAVNLRSSVAGAPQRAPVDEAPPPGGHYGIEDRYDDEAEGVADDGARYGVEPAGDEPSAWPPVPPGTNGAPRESNGLAAPDATPPPPVPSLEPTLEGDDDAGPGATSPGATESEPRTGEER